MCGIISIVTDKIAEWSVVVEPMLKALAHRGPDAKGVVTLDGCLLGHTRLSIIDLTSGSQPMTSIDDRYAISFNGEIYNFRELRNDLERLGYRFRTTSDTEVILSAYDAWGTDCLDHFRGMFAFALWDCCGRELFVARDLFGEKPIYFAESPGAFIVASEIKAIVASGLIKLKINLNAVDAYLALGYLPPDRTIYSNVQILPPGHYLKRTNGKLKIERYWQPILQTKQISIADAEDRLRELLQQAVTRQMVADVPVGAFLSGGIDSGTIVALMQMQSDRPVKTFSVGFGKHINELPYARAVARMYGTEHHEIDLGTPNVAGALLRMAKVYDEPFADTSCIPTYLISEIARKQVKVVLTGDGADELFGGYSWTYPMLVQSGNVPDSLFLWIILRSLSRLVNHRLKSLSLYSAGCGLAARRTDMWSRQVMQNIHIKENERRCLWGKRSGEIQHYQPGEYYRPPDGIMGVNRGFYFDLTSYLPGDILVKVDRAAMAHGLETRAPFLDRDLVEFALSLPVNLKIDGWKTKLLLKKTISQYLPQELLNRPKQGFGSPIDSWLDMPDVRELVTLVFLPQSPLRVLLPGITERNIQKCDYRTWILVTLGLWLEDHKFSLSD